jgi:hypothetical protein
VAANTSQVSAYSYGSGSVTTSAYTTIINSTSISCGNLQLIDTSGKIIKIAVGPAGSEVDVAVCIPSGTGANAGQVVPCYIPAGSRIAIKAIDATASSGYNLVSLLA